MASSLAAQSPALRVAVFGAGAVGCYYGGMLARAGYDVTLIGRPAHVEAIRQHGLRLHLQQGELQIPVTADTQAAALTGADLVLCCVKSTDTQAAASAMAPYLKAGARLLSLQNGVANAERLAADLGRPVAPAVVYVATAMTGPGQVRHYGRGELVIPPKAIPSTWQAAFTAAGIPLQLSDNVMGALWTKLILNSAYNAVSAISHLPYRAICEQDGITNWLRQLVTECETVAAAEGVTLPEPIWPAIEAIPRSMPEQRSSTYQDLIRGKATEIDDLNGEIVRRGNRHGIPTPINQTLHLLVRLLETRARSADRPAPSV